MLGSSFLDECSGNPISGMADNVVERKVFYAEHYL